MTRGIVAWLLGALLVIAGAFAVLPLGLQGPAMFAGDDTEYVTQALDTVEHLHTHGVVS